MVLLSGLLPRKIHGRHKSKNGPFAALGSSEEEEESRRERGMRRVPWDDHLAAPPNLARFKFFNKR